MNNKKIGFVAGAVVIIIAVVLIISQPAVTPTPTVPTPAPTAVASSGYTLAQVAAHKDASSCWSAVNGNVYDLTSWIGNHPGGEGAILSICGKDGSTAFNDQHGGKKKQADVLAGFKIGALTK